MKTFIFGVFTVLTILLVSCEGEIPVLSKYTEFELYVEENFDNNNWIQKIDIGQSESGRSIYCYKISDNVQTDEDEPELLIIGGIHGNERLSSFFVFKYFMMLIDNIYKIGNEHYSLLRSSEIFFIPVMNPDGYDNLTRVNQNGVDLNRNFEAFWSGLTEYHGSSPFDQNESTAVRDFALERNFTLMINYHTGEECLSFLWDYIGENKSNGSPGVYTTDEFTENYFPEFDYISEISEEYAESVRVNGNSAFYAIEGFDWYSVYGSMQDWFYYELGVPAFTAEISDLQEFVKNYNTPATTTVFDYQQEALTGLLRRGICGLHIKVIKGGKPVKARIMIEKSNDSRGYADPVSYSTFIISSDVTGAAHSVQKEGEYYNIKVEYEGVIKTFSNIKAKTFDGVFFEAYMD